MRFARKTFIITGASLGVGRALAEGLAREGADLVLNARSEAPLLAARDACRMQGVRAEALSGDVADTETAVGLVDIAVQMGGPDGFIHVAGVLHPGPAVWELTPQGFAEVMAASVVGAHQMIRHAVPHMLERGGFAVFFGSGAAERAQPGIGAYCAAKAAEESLCRQLAAETDKICAFVYRPGVVETRMQSEARNAEGGAADRIRPVFRGFRDQGLLISPEEAAAGLIGLLQSDPDKLHGGVWDVRNL